MGREQGRSRAGRLLRDLVPWADGSGRRLGRSLPLPAPFLAAYLALSWALFVPAAHSVDGKWEIDQERVRDFLFHIPAMSGEPLQAALSIITAPFLNHDSTQLLYVTSLLLIFGVPFEVREGSRRTMLVFFVTSTVAALVAGAFLHIVYPDLFNTGFFRTAWERIWSGGSAGSFGLMGAVAARARIPWVLLGVFIGWEIYIAFFRLRSYTPAFHFTALFAGLLIARFLLPPVQPPKPSSRGR